MRQNNLNTINQLISLFFQHLNESAEVKQALYDLGFEIYLNELETSHNEYLKLHAQRLKDISEREKGNTMPIQKELQYIMSILFEQVDYYQHVYSDVDYSKLITSLNLVDSHIH